MKYTLHSEPQGSDEWKAGRNSRLNASELVLAAGDGMNGRTRTDLIRKMATGIEPEVDAFTQKLYDEGHRFEALARPIAEQIIGRELYPITASIAVGGLSRRMGASLDGATDDDSDNFEHKRMNAELRAALAQGIIPVGYHWQMEQGQMINGATRTLFMASEWEKAPGEEADEGKVYGFAQNENGYEVRYALIEEMHVWYESNPVLRDRIIPIWKQAEDDAENYQHVEPAPVAVAAPMKELPTLFIQATGEVTATNMPDFKVQITEFLGSINMVPATDQEFADGKEVAKKLRELAKKIIERKEDMLAQTATIGEVAKEIDFLSKTINASALELEKAVEREEKARKLAIVVAGRMALDEHIGALNKRLGKPYMPTVAADFDAAIKGKRLLTAMDDAVATLLANKKVETSAIADRIEINLNYLRENAKEYPFLFADAGQIVLKANDDFEALAKLRISDHKEAEAKKLEAIKEAARVEAEAKAAAKVKDERDAEDAMIASIWASARRIEFNSDGPVVGYIEKAIIIFENGVRALHDDPRQRVAAAVAEARKEMQEKLAAAIAKSEQEEAERQRKAIDAAATIVPTTSADQHVLYGTPHEPAPPPDAQALRQAVASPCPATAVAAAPDNGRYIRLGELNALLGFTVTAEFLAGLGFVATQEKNARLYRECDVPAICQAIINHVAGVPARMRRAA